MAAGRHGGAAGELGDGGTVLLAHHDRGGEVVAPVQLVLAAQQVVLAVSPPGFGVGAGAAPGGRGPGEGLQVRPVRGQRGAGVPELLRDRCLQQGVADALQPAGGQPAGVIAAERVGDQAEGPLGLPVGQQVRAGFPVLGHAEPQPVGLGQPDQRVADPGQVRGPAVSLGEHHPGQQGADAQLPVPRPHGQHGLDPRRDAGGVDDLLEHRQRGHGPAAPSSRTAAASPALEPGGQVAEPLGAADPGRCHERGQPEQVRDLGQPRRPQPAGVQPRQARPSVQRSDQRAGDITAARVSPAADQPGPREPGCGQQPGVVAGQHRHGARPGAADGDHDPAGPARDVTSARVAQVAADQPGAGAQADQARRPHPPLRSGLGVRKPEIPRDLRRAVWLLWPAPAAAADRPDTAAAPPGGR